MADSLPLLRDRRQARRDVAYGRTLPWLDLQSRAWRPLDHLTRQVATALGREYQLLAPGAADPTADGEAGRVLLARSVLARLAAEGRCETHTAPDGQTTYSQTWLPSAAAPRTVDPGTPPAALPGVTVRPLTRRDRRGTIAIDAAASSP